jgi:hypothetical protein
MKPGTHADDKELLKLPKSILRVPGAPESRRSGSELDGSVWSRVFCYFLCTRCIQVRGEPADSRGWLGLALRYTENLSGIRISNFCSRSEW